MTKNFKKLKSTSFTKKIAKICDKMLKTNPWSKKFQYLYIKPLTEVFWPLRLENLNNNNNCQKTEKIAS